MDNYGGRGNGSKFQTNKNQTKTYRNSSGRSVRIFDITFFKNSFFGAFHVITMNFSLFLCSMTMKCRTGMTITTAKKARNRIPVSISNNKSQLRIKDTTAISIAKDQSRVQEISPARMEWKVVITTMKGTETHAVLSLEGITTSHRQARRGSTRHYSDFPPTSTACHRDWKRRSCSMRGCLRTWWTSPSWKWCNNHTQTRCHRGEEAGTTIATTITLTRTLIAISRIITMIMNIVRWHHHFRKLQDCSNTSNNRKNRHRHNLSRDTSGNPKDEKRNRSRKMEASTGVKKFWTLNRCLTMLTCRREANKSLMKEVVKTEEGGIEGEAKI